MASFKYSSPKVAVQLVVSNFPWCSRAGAMSGISALEDQPEMENPPFQADGSLLVIRFTSMSKRGYVTV